MKRQSGFTIIEGLVVAAIAAILLAIWLGPKNQSFKSTVGTADVRCVAGYLLVIDGKGHGSQLISETGKGVKCSE